MSNELKKIVSEIQYLTGATLAEIAAEVGYSRDYFTDQVNKGKNIRLRGMMERILEEKRISKEQGGAKNATQGPKEPQGGHISPDATQHPDHAKYVALLERTNATLEKSILLSLNSIQAVQADLLLFARENDNRTLELLRGLNEWRESMAKVPRPARKKE